MNLREKIGVARDRLTAAGIETGEAGRDAVLLALEEKRKICDYRVGRME